MSLTTLTAALERLLGNSDHKITSKLAEAAVERHEANLRALHPNEPRWGRGKGKVAKKNRKNRAADALLALGWPDGLKALETRLGFLACEAVTVAPAAPAPTVPFGQGQSKTARRKRRIRETAALKGHALLPTQPAADANDPDDSDDESWAVIEDAGAQIPTLSEARTLVTR